MSSDIMTLIQHWIEELSEITGEERPFSFRILVWELIYRGVMDQVIVFISFLFIIFSFVFICIDILYLILSFHFNS